MQNNQTNMKAIASLVVSILSVVCCCSWYISFILGAAAVILGVLAIREKNENQRDAGIAGIVVGATGMAFAIAIAVVRILLYSKVI